jgi:hypothetical protein
MSEFNATLVNPLAGPLLSLQRNKNPIKALSSSSTYIVVTSLPATEEM